MNKKALQLFGIASLAIFTLNQCSESNDEPDPCTNGPSIEEIEATPSVEGKDNGEILIDATGGTSPYQFSVDGTNFQSDDSFSDLAPGDYTVTVKDANGCTATEMVTVAEIPEVFFANQIKPIIDANCQVSGCHGSNSNIPSFATYDDIKDRANGIKFRTSNKTMPPGGPLSDDDIQLISHWVDQGAPNN
jgi:hypothetical protein